MRKTVFFLVTMLMFGIFTNAYADESDILVSFNGEKLEFNSSPIIVNERSLVQLRPIAEAMGLEIEFETVFGRVILSDGKTEVRFSVESDVVTVNGEDSKMDAPMKMKDDYTFIPVRSLVEPFGYEISYDAEERKIEIILPKPAEPLIPVEPDEVTDKIPDEAPVEVPKKTIDEIIEELDLSKVSTGSGKYPFTFYYQSQPEFQLENSGRGYCWVCSYAMLISDILGEKITPLDIAKINIENGYGGSYVCWHKAIVKRFGLKLVPAIPETSKYYGGFDVGNRGETVILAETDEDAYNAICEALDNFPGGVIVRYDGYPHSMVAVGYDEEEIYFNDPGVVLGEHTTFDKTCLKNFKLSDISSIQAIER